MYRIYCIFYTHTRIRTHGWMVIVCVSRGRPPDRGQERGADGQDERAAADGSPGGERD